MEHWGRYILYSYLCLGAWIHAQKDVPQSYINMLTLGYVDPITWVLTYCIQYIECVYILYQREYTGTLDFVCSKNILVLHNDKIIHDRKHFNILS